MSIPQSSGYSLELNPSGRKAWRESSKGTTVRVLNEIAWISPRNSVWAMKDLVRALLSIHASVRPSFSCRRISSERTDSPDHGRSVIAGATTEEAIRPNTIKRQETDAGIRIECPRFVGLNGMLRALGCQQTAACDTLASATTHTVTSA